MTRLLGSIFSSLNTAYRRRQINTNCVVSEYTPIETDPEIDKAMRDVVLAGMISQDKLPDLPPPPDPADIAPVHGRVRKGRKRHK